MRKIRVMIVDDITDTRESIRRLLEFEKDIEVVGEAGSGSEALTTAENIQPDIVLMDINMPDMDGIRATELMAERVPVAKVIMISVQGEQEYLRKAMGAGAKDYLVKPFSGSDLANTIVKVHALKRPQVETPQQVVVRKNKTITFFSTKGGVGKTVIAANVAVALAQNKALKVLFLDLDLQFGDGAVFLNTVPKRTIADIDTEEDPKTCVAVHSSGLDFIAGAMGPEEAEKVQLETVKRVIAYAKETYDFVIIDTQNQFGDVSLLALDEAEEIWLVVSLDLPTIKDSKLCLELMSKLGFINKVKIILNRSGADVGLENHEIQGMLGMPTSFKIPSDGKAVISALNAGKPFVIEYPHSKASEGILNIVETLVGSPPKTASKKTKFRFFGRK